MSDAVVAGANGLPTIRLLGPPQLRLNGKTLALERRGAGVLAYLVLQGATQRAAMATLLWPEVDDAAARRNLRQRLFRMRSLAGVDLVAGDPLLSLDARIQIDLLNERIDPDAAFTELLSGCEFPDCPAFADWLAGARQRRRDALLATLGAAATAREAQGELAQAIPLAQRIIDANVLSEHAYRRLMRLHYLHGDRAAAIAVFESCEQKLKHELGARPDAETIALLQTIEKSAPESRAMARLPLPASVLRPPQLIGRDAELAAMRQAWAAGEVVLLTGEAGAGKSRLIETAAADASAVVVRSRAGDQNTPYALLGRLLRAVVGTLRAPLPAELRAELARLLPEMGLVRPMEGPADQVRFMHAIEATLALAASSGLGLLVLDDLHLADAASGEALTTLAGGDLHLHWLFAGRRDELDAPILLALNRLRCISVALRPLSEPDIGALLDSLQLTQFNVALLAAPLARHAGGNPLFVLETVKQMLTGHHGAPAETGVGSAEARLPVPERVQAIIEQRLRRLSAPAVRLLRCAALAGQDFDATLAGEVLGCRPLDLADAWTELEAQQILSGNSFTHDLIAAAALHSVPAPVACAIHAEVARGLATRSGDPGRIAGHFAAAGEPAAAVPHWLAAGHVAQASLRYLEAARFFEQAARAALAHGQRDTAFDAAKLMRTAAFEIDLAELSEASLALLEQASDTPARQAFTLSERAVTSLHRGDLDGTLRHAREGLRVLGDADTPLVRIELHRNLAAVHTFRNETFAALAEMRSVQRDVEALAPPELRFQFFQSLAIVCDHADQWDEAERLYRSAIQLGLDVGNVAGVAQTWLNYVVGLHDHGEAVQALLALERAHSLIATMPAGHPSYSSLDLNYAIVLRMSGDFAGALRHIEPAVRVGAVQTPGWLPLIRANEAHLWMHLGQVARAHQALQAAPPGDATPLAAVSKWHTVHADVERALGHAAPALETIIARLPSAGRRTSRWRLQIKSLSLDADDARVWQTGQVVLQELRDFGRAGMFIHLGSLLATRAARSGDARAGAALAHDVLNMLVDHEPDDITRGHALTLCAHALAASADARAEAVTASSLQWMRDTAATKVPAEFRSSFCNRHSGQQMLLRTAPDRLDS